ncbi:MAG: TauD/TfdA family dioxygenase [Acidimicrobiales bacterium]|nr:TauD/TfdA family dioxygenase [Acidimicrobiales bacterium]
MQLRRLSPALGAEVLELDLASPIGPEEAEELRRALLDHQLLLVRGQALTDLQHVEFARVFGRIAAEGSGPIGIVSNQPGGILGGDRASWHADYTFFPSPYEVLSLFGLEIPDAGTQTSFVNGVLAARTLPEELRRRVEGLQARAVLAFDGGSLTDGIRYRLGRRDDAVIQQVRPVLWPHRSTGEPILAVWEQQTDALLPLDPEASDALLEELFAHLYRPEHQYVHHWRTNDLVLWDNHALQHARPMVGSDAPRTLRRVCVGEDQDLAAFAVARAAGAGGGGTS